MYFLFKMGIFHCYVCLPEGITYESIPPCCLLGGLPTKGSLRCHLRLFYQPRGSSAVGTVACKRSFKEVSILGWSNVKKHIYAIDHLRIENLDRTKKATNWFCDSSKLKGSFGRKGILGKKRPGNSGRLIYLAFISGIFRRWVVLVVVDNVVIFLVVAVAVALSSLLFKIIPTWMLLFHIPDRQSHPLHHRRILRIQTPP